MSKSKKANDKSSTTDDTDDQQPTDYSKVCRICLFGDGDMISMITNYTFNVISEVFYSITGLQVTLEDKIPLAICLGCHDKLMDCYKFKLKCIESNNILRGYTTRDTTDNGDTEEITEAYYNPRSEKNKDNKLNKSKSQSSENLEEDLYLSNSDLSDSDSASDTPDNVLILKRKIKKSDKKHRFTCRYCPKKFLKFKTLKVHSEVCTGQNVKKHRFKCSDCTQSFNSEYDLNLHSAIHVKGNIFECLSCAKKFTDRPRFRRHIRRHMDMSKRWPCLLCGKTFTEHSGLRRHMRVHTGEVKEKAHECKICDKKFGDKHMLLEHNSRHTGVRPCTCDVCGKTFASPRLLTSHSRIHLEEKPYECEYCFKRFREKSTRDTHHRTHTGERPFVCSVCGKAFIQSSNLSLHMRTHTGEKPYSCEECGRKFSSGSTLACHKRVHTGEKPYSCSICGKRFARTDFKSHLRTHTGERPYVCCACPKHFVSAAALREHRRVHTGEQPFQCTLCPENYKKKIHLMNHLKTHKDKKVKNEKAVGSECTPYAGDESIYTKDTDLINIRKAEFGCQNEINVALNKNQSPVNVSDKLVLLDDNDVNTERVAVDDGKCSVIKQSSKVSLNEVIVGGELHMNKVSVITKNETNLSRSMQDGAKAKLYHLDERLMQAQATGGQVIREIISKMTTNF